MSKVKARRHFTTPEIYHCKRCGGVRVIQRPASLRRSQGHPKPMYCPNCKGKQMFINYG